MHDFIVRFVVFMIRQFNYISHYSQILRSYVCTEIPVCRIAKLSNLTEHNWFFNLSNYRIPQIGSWWIFDGTIKTSEKGCNCKLPEFKIQKAVLSFALVIGVWTVIIGIYFFAPVVTLLLLQSLLNSIFLLRSFFRFRYLYQIGTQLFELKRLFKLVVCGSNTMLFIDICHSLILQVFIVISFSIFQLFIKYVFLIKILPDTPLVTHILFLKFLVQKGAFIQDLII